MALFRCTKNDSGGGGSFTGTITITGYVAHKYTATTSTETAAEITKSNYSQRNSKTITITIENGVVTSYTDSIQKTTQKAGYSTSGNSRIQGGFWVTGVTIS